MTNAIQDPTGTAAPAPMVLYVCTTCRDADHVVGQGAPCAGARLFAAISAAPVDPAITIVPVECLSVCKRTCAVSFAAPGKWTYVYGDLPAETAASTTRPRSCWWTLTAPHGQPLSICNQASFRQRPTPTASPC